MPEKHGPPPCPCPHHKMKRQCQAKYHRKMMRLGFTAGLYPHTELKEIERVKRYHKEHREKQRAAVKRYKTKAKAEKGSTSHHEMTLYAIDNFERKYAKRTTT